MIARATAYSNARQTKKAVSHGEVRVRMPAPRAAVSAVMPNVAAAQRKRIAIALHCASLSLRYRSV